MQYVQGFHAAGYPAGWHLPIFHFHLNSHYLFSKIKKAVLRACIFLLYKYLMRCTRKKAVSLSHRLIYGKTIKKSVNFRNLLWKTGKMGAISFLLSGCSLIRFLNSWQIFMIKEEQWYEDHAEDFVPMKNQEQLLILKNLRKKQALHIKILWIYILCSVLRKKNVPYLHNHLVLSPVGIHYDHSPNSLRVNILQ